MDLIYRSKIHFPKIDYLVINLPILFLFYSLFLFVLPDEIFESTAIYTFKTTEGVAYNWNNFYVSYLFFPIIAYGLYLSFANLFYKKAIFELPLIGFLVLIVLKDIILNVFFNNYIGINNCFEYYWEFLVAFCFVRIFYKNSKTNNDFVKLFLVFGFLNLIMLFVGVFIGHSSTSGEYAYRYTSPNLNHNSTGFLMLMCFSLSLILEYKYKGICSVAFFIGIVLTGNRSGLLFALVIIFLYFVTNFKKTLLVFRKGTTWLFLTFFLIGLFVVFNLNLSNINTRFSEMIDGISRSGLINYIAYDKTSGASRIVGWTVGIQMLHDNWLLGTGLSCYSLQHAWTIYAGPSAFPHFDWMCYWMMFGILSIPVFYLLLSSLLRLWKAKSIFWLFGLIIIIRTLTDGGLWQNSKNIFFIAYSFSLLYSISKQELYEKKCRRFHRYCEL